MLENLELMKMRARAAGNDRQHNRMIIDKQRSLHRALLYSYQAAWVKKDNDSSADWVRALMNPDKVKFDYDEKVISIDWEHNFRPGDTFEWGKGTGSHWMVLKTEDTELAYLRANCRRCQKLSAFDPINKEMFSQWCVIRGPVETKINTIQKAGIIADVPNLTLDIYMADTERNRRTFERYVNFEFDERFWKVQAVDFISTPGVYEIVAEEDYECHNHEQYLQVEKPEPVPAEVNEILGDVSIKPCEKHCYMMKLPATGEWTITLPATKNKEIDDVMDYTIDGDKIFVTWTMLRSGSFILHYGEYEKTVNVESLF